MTHHPPLHYDGRDYTADKEFVAGTHRAMPPEVTLERIRPHLHHGAITRVADITGLDTIGIPVAVAMRPASATLAVEGGKGVTLEAAITSAAMEAIERYVAEVDDVVDRRGRVDEVADRLPVPADRFPMFRYSSISPTRTYEWTAVRNLFDDEEYLVPTDLVDLPTDGTTVAPFGQPWAAGSNGLASGNNLPEAICAGLYEVIERDATTCWQRAHRSGSPRLVIDQTTIDGPVIRTILATLEEAGAEAQIVWCPTDVGVPTCLAFLLNKEPGVGVSKGYGCHLDPEIAMIRAVTEAVQSRTIFVAGARDDLLRPSYEAMKRSDVLVPEEFGRDVHLVSVADIANRATSSFHGDVAVLLQQLDRAGFDHVLARRLDADVFDASVARVIVPGLEPYAFQWVATGRRAREFDAMPFIA